MNVGSVVPVVQTCKPAFITLPPMIVGPMIAQIDPTFGGTNVSSGDGGVWEPDAAGVVAALAPATGDTVEGRTASKNDIENVFRYEKLLGPKYNPTLSLQDRILPHQTVDRMAGARFELPEAAVDGHVDMVTAPILASAGANVFVCGTGALFHGPHQLADYAASLAAMREAIAPVGPEASA